MKLVVCGVAIATSLFLSGCGSDKPEDIAKTFVNALSNADMKEAKSVATNEVQKQLKKIYAACNRPKEKSLRKESAIIIDEINNKSKDSKYKKQADEMMTQFEKDNKNFEEKLKKELIAKFGSKQALQNLPREEQKKIQNEMLEKITKLVNPLVEKQFSLFNIKTDSPKEVKEIVAVSMVKGIRSLNDIVRDVVSKQSYEITPECIDKHTEFGLIDSINVIETKKNSPDKTNVRLEIVHKDGKSEKISLPIEKIQEEWKVSDMSLKNIGYW